LEVNLASKIAINWLAAANPMSSVRAPLFGIRRAIATSILSAYSAVNQGHCHPKILAAMVEQAGRLTLTSRAFTTTNWPSFTKRSRALTGSHKVLPMNSGAGQKVYTHLALNRMTSGRN
jgi:hypothetical protein